jgi:phage gp29-like protein
MPDPINNPLSQRQSIPGAGLPPTKRPRKPLPPPIDRGLTGPLAMPVEVQRTFFRTASLMLRNSSLAYRLDPNYQAMMRADADIEGVLRSLLVTLAGLEWNVLPDDESDPRLVKLAERIAEIIGAAPRRSDMFRSLHEAVWYGCSAVNVVYDRDPRLGVRIREWLPLASDTLAFDQTGNVAMRVGSAYINQASITDLGFDSLVHLFDDNERRAIVLHRVFTTAPNFIDPNSAETVYRGVGARDVCWYIWLLKQEVLQNAAAYVERYALGIRVGYYPAGNDAAKSEMMTILQNLVNDNSVVLPRISPTESMYDIDIKDANGGRAQIFMELVNWLSGKLKEAILGQSLSSEAGGTGMGSGVADLHADTLSRVIRYHADCLAESLTTDLVRIIAGMLGASEEDARRIRFVFAPERPNPKERLEAIQTFIQMGGRVSEREVRDLLGLSDPEDGESVLGGQAAGSAGASSNPLSAMLGQGNESEGDEPAPEAPKVAAVRKRKR